MGFLFLQLVTTDCSQRARQFLTSVFVRIQPDCRFVHIYRYFKGSSYLLLPGSTSPRHIPPNSFPPSSNQFFENTYPFLFLLFHCLHIQSVLQGWWKCSLSPERIASPPKIRSTTAYRTSSRIYRCISCYHLVCGCCESRAHGTCCVSDIASFWLHSCHGTKKSVTSW
jgi:hypothetical protein